MPRYRWTGDGPFSDNRNDRAIEPGDVADLPANVAGPHDGLVPVDESDGTADDFDAEEWLGHGDYLARTDRVESGEMDEHLGKILQIETSQTVKDAVAERREVLDGTNQ